MAFSKNPSAERPRHRMVFLAFCQVGSTPNSSQKTDGFLRSRERLQHRRETNETESNRLKGEDRAKRHGNPPGKLADAELLFVEGPLEGLKLLGFAVWECRGGGRNVAFSARQYSVNDERRFGLLR